MTKTKSKPAILLMIISLCLFLGNCSTKQSKPAGQIDFSIENGIAYYDIFFEIDPVEDIFRSEQKVTITG
ncbi:MAG: hypothetical protein PVG14_15245, partial [Anaerolineales bacterium]